MTIKTMLHRMRLLALIMGIMIIIQVINASNGYFLTQFGVYPRRLSSLPYIFTAPFIHGSYSHLINNLAGFGLFSILCLLHSTRFYITRCLFIIIVSGFLVWCFGRPTYHVGLSGLIFGLWALLIALAYFQSNILNIILALLIIIFYGGMLYGIFSVDQRTSFEFHIAGVVAGILCASLWRTKRIR